MPERPQERSEEWLSPSLLGQEKLVVEEVCRIAAADGCTPERAADLGSALAEAWLNAAEHGNGLDPTRSVRVRLALTNSLMTIRVYDEGDGAFAAAPVDGRERDRRPPAPSSAPSDDVARGWGIPLMRELADELSFGRDKNGFYAELRFYRTWRRNAD